MRRTMNVSCMAKKLNAYRSGNLKERNHWGNLGLDRRILLKWILKRQNGREWTGLICV